MGARNSKATVKTLNTFSAKDRARAPTRLWYEAGIAVGIGVVTGEFVSGGVMDLILSTRDVLCRILDLQTNTPGSLTRVFRRIQHVSRVSRTPGSGSLYPP